MTARVNPDPTKEKILEFLREPDNVGKQKTAYQIGHAMGFPGKNNVTKQLHGLLKQNLVAHDKTAKPPLWWFPGPVNPHVLSGTSPRGRSSEGEIQNKRTDTRDGTMILTPTTGVLREQTELAELGSHVSSSLSDVDDIPTMFQKMSRLSLKDCPDTQREDKSSEPSVQTPLVAPQHPVPKPRGKESRDDEGKTVLQPVNDTHSPKQLSKQTADCKGKPTTKSERGATSPPQQQPRPPPELVSAKATDDSLDRYRMESSPRGVAVIINNRVFSGNLKLRKGTDQDADGLKQLFEWLGFDVRLFNNLTREQMVKVLGDMSQLDHSSMDCLVVAVLTHGKEGKLYGCDAELIDVEDIFTPFNGRNCPKLIGKPKVFIIQACRGNWEDRGVELTDGEGVELTLDQIEDTEEMLNDETDGKTLVPTEADMVVLYATMPRFVAMRNNHSGTWFIQAFLDIMLAHAAKESFSTIITRVNSKVANRKSIEKPRRKQMPQATTQLTKQLYFNPPSEKH